MVKVGKRVCSLCLCIVLLALFVSCASHRSAVAGRWETRIEDEELGTISMVYHFTEDGEIFLEQKKDDTIPFSIPFGTFFVKGEQLTIESDGVQKVYTFSVKEGTLTLSEEGQPDLVFTQI